MKENFYFFFSEGIVICSSSVKAIKGSFCHHKFIAKIRVYDCHETIEPCTALTPPFVYFLKSEVLFGSCVSYTLSERATTTLTTSIKFRTKTYTIEAIIYRSGSPSREYQTEFILGNEFFMVNLLLQSVFCVSYRRFVCYRVVS